MEITPKSLGATEQGQVIKVLTGENQFSDLIEFNGQFNLSIIPLTHEGGSPIAQAFNGTVTLQRAFVDILNINNFVNQTFIPPGDVVIWSTVSVHTTTTELVDVQPIGALFRIGILTGQFGTAGSKVLVRLGK